MRILILVALATLIGNGVVAQATPVHTETGILGVQEAKVEQLNKVDLKISDIASSGKIKTPPPPQNNEDVAWNFFIANGFTRNQTAGILGNLKQEHQFRTDGDGLAQWTDNRKANMLARPNNQDINVQLNYLMEELNGTESIAGSAIRSASTVEDSVRAFQNKFERCGDCRESTRIQYANEILARH